MKRLAVRLSVTALAATVALVLILDLGARRRGLVVAVYLDVLCALVLIWLAAAVRSALPQGRELNRPARAPRPGKAPRPPQLEWLERQVGHARDYGYEIPSQFRPVIRNIAATALWRRHSVVLESDPDRARELVGEHVWQVIRPDDPVTELPRGGFRALVAELEAI
jgi:hypothetical protein